MFTVFLTQFILYLYIKRPLFKVPATFQSPAGGRLIEVGLYFELRI